MSNSVPTTDSLALVAQHVRAGNRSMARLELDLQMSVHGDELSSWLWEAWLAESPSAARSTLRRAQELDPDNRVIAAALTVIQGILDWRPAGIDTDFDVDSEFLINPAHGRLVARSTEYDIETDFDVDPEFIVDPVDDRPMALLEFAAAAVDSVATADGESSLAFESAKIPILVVDDSRTLRELVSFTLSNAGYKVISASNGAEALREITQWRPALVLCDTIMPKVDGYELCRLINKHEATRDIPVVLLSENDGIVEKLRRTVVGCSDHLAKPFESQTLIDKVRQHAVCPDQVVDR